MATALASPSHSTVSLSTTPTASHPNLSDQPVKKILVSPLIIVHPPLEDGDEPSISFAANDQLSGLPNGRRTRVQSALNSTLQVFMAVPEMTEELPFSSSNECVQKFVSTVRYIHCEASNVAEPVRVDLNWWRDLAGLPRSQDVAEDDMIESVAEYEKVGRSLLDGVLGICRIGRRFISERKVEAPVVPKSSTPAASSIRRKDSFDTFSASSLMNDADPPTASGSDDVGFRASEIGGKDEGGGAAAAAEKEKGSVGSLLNVGESPYMLTLPLDGFSETETVGVISLLNKTLGLQTQPTFFFGYGGGGAGGLGGAGLVRNSIFASELSRGPNVTSPSTPTPLPTRSARSNSIPKPPPPGPTIRFTKLPELLVLSFKRPLSSAQPGVYHRTTVEMPMDLDLGFAMDAVAVKRGQKEKNTFYKLHGFVTQTEGRFLAYTRSLGGFKWFKCEDEVVVEADLGARVASKGVLLALYRLQEKRH
ncbi:hypothetical protein HDU67_008175 [Dinochytrium kinnereticum]|nr:hypothetical protein HDU67_008175 [Dinochytrium kinnereticum]